LLLGDAIGIYIRDKKMASYKFRWVQASFMALAFALVQPAHAQSDDAAKQAAVERYQHAAPMKDVMEKMYEQFAKKVPSEKQAQYIADMRSVINIDRLEQISKDGMVKTMSLEELNALADFYTSPHGASAMAKMGAFMSEVMPLLMQEVQRGVQELQSRNKK
jgi:hypothetical protein